MDRAYQQLVLFSLAAVSVVSAGCSESKRESERALELVTNASFVQPLPTNANQEPQESAQTAKPTSAAAKEWPKTYAAALKKSGAEEVIQADSRGQIIPWILRLPTPAERDVLKQIRACPADERLQILSAFVAAASEADAPRQPLEYVTQAVVGDDPQLRERIINELLVPGFAKADLTENQRIGLLRIAIETNSVLNIPAAAAPTGEFFVNSELPNVLENKEGYRYESLVLHDLYVQTFATLPPEARAAIPYFAKPQDPSKAKSAIPQQPRLAPPGFPQREAPKLEPDMTGKTLLFVVKSPFSYSSIPEDERASLVKRVVQALMETKKKSWTDIDLFEKAVQNLGGVAELGSKERLAIVGFVAENARSDEDWQRALSNVVRSLLGNSVFDDAMIRFKAILQLREQGHDIAFPPGLIASIRAGMGRTAIRDLTPSISEDDQSVLPAIVAIGENVAPEVSRRVA